MTKISIYTMNKYQLVYKFSIKTHEYKLTEFCGEFWNYYGDRSVDIDRSLKFNYLGGNCYIDVIKGDGIPYDRYSLNDEVVIYNDYDMLD